MSDKVNYSKWQKAGNAKHYKTPYKRLYNKMIRCAERKGIPVNMSYKEFVEFTKIKKCHYCNASIKWVKHGKKATAYNLDRKYKRYGYSVKNCVVACWKCNNAKSNVFSYKTWLKMTECFRN